MSTFVCLSFYGWVWVSLCVCRYVCLVCVCVFLCLFVWIQMGIMYVYMREWSFSVVTWSDNYRGIFLFSLIHSILLSTCWDPPALRVRSYRHSWVKLGKVHIMFPEFSEWIPIVQRKFCIRLYVWMFFTHPSIVFILIFFWPVCVDWNKEFASKIWGHGFPGGVNSPFQLREPVLSVSDCSIVR